MKVDEFLSEREQPSRVFLAVVEPVADRPDRVRLTPYLRDGGGCLCDHGVLIPKTIIEDVEPIGEVHLCCGKAHRVVRVRLHDGATLSAHDVLEAATSRAASRVRARAQDQCDCEGLWEGLEEQQARLRAAPPQDKPKIIAKIRALIQRLEDCGCL